MRRGRMYDVFTLCDLSGIPRNKHGKLGNTNKQRRGGDPPQREGRVLDGVPAEQGGEDERDGARRAGAAVDTKEPLLVSRSSGGAGVHASQAGIPASVRRCSPRGEGARRREISGVMSDTKIKGKPPSVL